MGRMVHKSLVQTEVWKLSNQHASFQLENMYIGFGEMDWCVYVNQQGPFELVLGARKLYTDTEVRPTSLTEDAQTRKHTGPNEGIVLGMHSS